MGAIPAARLYHTKYRELPPGVKPVQGRVPFEDPTFSDRLSHHRLDA